MLRGLIGVPNSSTSTSPADFVVELFTKMSLFFSLQYDPNQDLNGQMGNDTDNQAVSVLYHLSCVCQKAVAAVKTCENSLLTCQSFFCKGLRTGLLVDGEVWSLWFSLTYFVFFELLRFGVNPGLRGLLFKMCFYFFGREALIGNK